MSNQPEADPAETNTAAETEAEAGVCEYKLSVIGRTDAFSAALGDCLEMAKVIVRRIVRGDSEVDDIVQEAAIKAYAGNDQFREQAKFSTWFCQIARNEALLALKRDGARMCAYEELRLTGFQSDPTPHAVLQTKENIDFILHAVVCLPKKLSEVVYLAAIECRSVDEISAMLGCPKATVYWRLYSARKILRELLKGMWS